MIKEEYRWLTDTYVAHRGLFNKTDAPENSIPAFKLAVENGFGIETDVQMSSDGVLVVFHDDTLDRMTGFHGNLCDLTFSELRELRLAGTDCQIPTFEEFLQVANGVNLVVEIKKHKHIGEVERKVCEALASYKGNYCIESFDPLIVRWFKVHAPNIIRGQLACDFSKSSLSRLKKFLCTNLKLCKWNGSQFIAYDVNAVKNNAAIAKWTKRVPIICWTVKSQTQYDEMHDCFDNMIFDSFLPERHDLPQNNAAVAEKR